MIVAAGRGSRFGASQPKQYLQLKEQTLLQLSVARLATSAYISNCLLVIAADDIIAQTLEFAMPVAFVQGGAERWQSVCLGVEAIVKQDANDDDLIVIHDAARPSVPTADIEKVIEAAICEPYGAILATPVADTLKRAQNQPTHHSLLPKESINSVLDNDSNSYYTDSTLDRSQVWQAQTPQVFRLGQLRKVLVHVIKQNLSITDESSAFEQLNLPIKLVTGSRQNIKITYPDDAILIAAIIDMQLLSNIQ